MKLFDRANGIVRLTDAGRAYIDIGRKMLDLEHQLEGCFSDRAAYKVGTISIGVSAHRSVALMPPIVKAFKALYPGITLKIIERYRAELMDEAEHGGFDLVITTLPVDKETFCYETVFVEENVVATKEHLDAKVVKGKKYLAVSASALNNLPFAMLNDNHLMQRELEELIRKHNLHLQKEVECTSLEALVEMVKNGVGSAFIPSCLAIDPNLNYYSIQEMVPKREIVIMYRKEQYLSRAVQDLKELVHKLLG